MDGRAKDEATVSKALEGLDEMFEVIAAGLYSLASMLVGEGEDSVRLVEISVANAEVSSCHAPQVGRRNSRTALATAALDLLARRDPASLAAPQGLEPAHTCIEDDDLTSAGISTEELENMIGGPDRDRVRSWLASLPTPCAPSSSCAPWPDSRPRRLPTSSNSTAARTLPDGPSTRSARPSAKASVRSPPRSFTPPRDASENSKQRTPINLRPMPRS